MSSMDRIELNVTINGTDINPWHRFGLRQNPFPQTGKAEYAAGERKLASLDGDPVRTADDIRERLAGFAPEFVEGVIQRWQPGRASDSRSIPGGRNTAELPGMDEITIGARLRILRRWRDKTQTELVGLAGLSPSFISMVETGQRPLDR